MYWCVVNAGKLDRESFQLPARGRLPSMRYMSLQMEPIGVVETCYAEKFGVPRQPGLVPQAWGRVIFDAAFRGEDFLRGIEDFSHLWLIFQFHQAPAKKGRGTVRPPRLGGNERKGVFATRAPYRPNGIGLSVVELVKVDRSHPDGPVLEVRGVDLVNGTPILDVKPYVKFCDSVEDARSGFVTGEPERISVVWECECSLDPERVGLIESTIALDPRPAYQEDSSRIYGCSIDACEVRWRVDGGRAIIVELSAASP